MIHFIEYGNIFKIEDVNSYAHGCNCAGAMGKGIAVQFKKKFPEMYNNYKAKCLNGEFKPGDVYEYKTKNGYVYNLGTQLTWRTKATINAIENSVEKMMLMALESKTKSIALPKIGAGLGGLKWEDVKSTLVKVSEKFPDIELFVIENYIE